MSENPAREWLLRARAGNAVAFDQLVAPHCRPLHAHCYRMLGSPFDADDALQETLLAAWRGLASFEERSSLKTWLYRIATNICLRLISKRPRRMISTDHSAPRQSTVDLGEPMLDVKWLEPLPDNEAPRSGSAGENPASVLLRREHIGLAYVAMLHRLPAMQRAVLLLREVLDYSAAETAAMLDITVAAVNSALQRARRTIRGNTPPSERAAELPKPIGRDLEILLRDFVYAWESRDVAAMLTLLAEDVRFTMPPLPAWFSGRDDVMKFFTERVFQTAWRLRPVHGNSQPSFACYLRSEGDDRFRPAGVLLLSVNWSGIAALDSFLDPAVCRRFGMVDEVF